MAIDQPRLDDARKALVEEVQTLVGEVVFNKTYFSLEETGLGYGVIRRPDGLSTEEYERLNAFLRVFTDAYRVQGGRWNAQPRPWASVRDIPKRSAVRRLAERIWPSPEVDGQLAGVLAIIAAGGRAGRAQSTRQLALPQVAAQQLQPAVRSQVLTHELDVQVSLEHASQPRCAQTHQNGLLCVGSDVGTSIPTKTFPLRTHRRPFLFTRILALSRPSYFRIGARSTDPLRAALRSVHPRTPGRYSGI